MFVLQSGTASQATDAAEPALRTRRRIRHDYVLPEELFTTALEREFKRADRFDESFALLLISLNGLSRADAWAEVIEVLTATKLDTDIVGWLTRENAVGLIRPLINQPPAEAAAALSLTVQQELARVLSDDTAASCSIRLEVFSQRREGTLPEVLQPKSRRERMTEVAADVSKRMLDIVGSLILLALLSPVFLIVSALIRFTSEGPILFRQTRVGRNGRPFTMLKFRTMYVNADESIHQKYVTQFIQTGAAADSGSNVFKIVNDPRITPIGHFLRRSSLDELPQFWNVLRGDMSLVGPRPPLPYEVERYKRWHRRRLFEAKPGITGLWQVTARSRTTFDEMVRLDLRYARKSSLWTDIRILLATPRAVLSGKGAH
jgi:exopolysaccharide biosynthesis polyprenyl glycosylphosphotransferase